MFIVDFSFKIEARNSASHRVFVNKSTGEFRSSFVIYSIIESATSEIVPSMYFISTSYFLIDVSLMILHFLFVPTTNFAVSSILPIVSYKPTLLMSDFERSEERRVG